MGDAGSDTDRTDTAAPADTAEGEVCDDGIDNDENGAVDCADEACTGVPRCAFTAMSSGRSHTCGVVESGEVVCWGDNFMQSFADLEKVYLNPVQFADLETPRDVAPGNFFTCWADAEDRGFCQGQGDYGQLGRPIAEDSTSTPQRVVPPAGNP